MLKAKCHSERINDKITGKYLVSLRTHGNDTYYLEFTFNNQLYKFENTFNENNIHSNIIMEIANDISQI